MNIQDRYTWEAEKENGEIVCDGGDLTGCRRISLIPQAFGLPQHDLVGIPMINRFGRGFIRVMGNKPPEYIHCVVCKGFRVYIRSSNGTVLITPQDYELYL